MSLLYITVEGQTEQDFCHRLLKPYLYARSGIVVIAQPVTTNARTNSKGGAVKWDKFYRQVSAQLTNSPSAWHSMMFDLYRLHDTFPNCQAAAIDGYQRANNIENGILNEVGHYRFLPYIQVYEFESLLFSDPDVLHRGAALDVPITGQPFHKILSEFNGPEWINDSVETAPSKRICQIYPGFKKTLHGILIAEQIGIDKMRKMCPHFNEWVSKLLTLA